MASNVVALTQDDRSWMSDGELSHGVDRIWAVALFKGQRAHFWRQTDQAGYARLCDGGVVSATMRNGQNRLFGAGNYPKCKRCMNKINNQ